MQFFISLSKIMNATAKRTWDDTFRALRGNVFFNVTETKLSDSTPQRTLHLPERADLCLMILISSFKDTPPTSTTAATFSFRTFHRAMLCHFAPIDNSGSTSEGALHVEYWAGFYMRAEILVAECDHTAFQRATSHHPQWALLGTMFLHVRHFNHEAASKNTLLTSIWALGLNVFLLIHGDQVLDSTSKWTLHRTKRAYRCM